jgi:hypothetical protein
VEQEHPEMSAIRPNKEVFLMSAVAEASTLLRSVAEPCPAGDSVKSAINRAAKRVAKFIPPHWSSRWHAGRAEDIWRQEARGVWAEEMDAIRRAADARLAQEARNEHRTLMARIARIETAMGLPDADFAEPHVDAFRQSVGGSHRAVDRD